MSRGIFSISTAWNRQRHERAAPMIQEIRSTGVGRIELSLTLTQELVREIHALAQDGRIEITSLHNFCPIPDGLAWEKAGPDVYSLSSLNEAEREEAVRYTERTIETARLLGARAVVLHCGRVEMEDPGKALAALYDLGRKGSVEFELLRESALRIRQERAAPHREQVLKSLDRVSRTAQSAGVALGIETRYYVREIPFLGEMGEILDAFPGRPVHYWHDMGHARVQEVLGLTPPGYYLERHGTRLLGFHIHNVQGTRDHQAPLDGELDLASIAPHVREETLLVLESRKGTAEDLASGVRALRQVLNHG